MMTFLDEAMKGANKPLGFLTLSALTDTAPEQMMPNAEYIATALMAGLQVMCHTWWQDIYVAKCRDTLF